MSSYWLGLRIWARHLLLFGLAACAATAHAAFPVVTTTTDLQSLVQVVGGDRVQVTSLVTAGSNPESYTPRPQDLERIRQARMVVRIGLDYDLWLDRLLRQSNITGMQRGGAAHVDSSNAITLLEVKQGGLGGGTHAHGAGNPHFWLDPLNSNVITGNIVEALARLDPTNAKYYEKRRIDFLSELERRVSQWQERLAPLAGRPLLAYHNNWPYMARRFKLNIAATVEPRPGIAPSPASLAKLMRRMRDENIHIIIRQPSEPSKDVDFLAQKANGTVVILATSVGDLPQATDYFSLFEYNVSELLKAYANPAK